MNVVQVATGVTRRSDGSGSLTSVSIDVRAGESWRIYGDRTARDVIVTSNCAGSRPLSPDKSMTRPRPAIPASAESWWLRSRLSQSLPPFSCRDSDARVMLRAALRNESVVRGEEASARA